MCAHLCRGNLNIAIESKIQFHAKFWPEKLKIFAPKQKLELYDDWVKNWNFLNHDKTWLRSKTGKVKYVLACEDQEKLKHKIFSFPK